MARTPEQIEADAHLVVAVEACARAYGVPLDDGYTLSDFVVVTESIRWDAEDNTAYDEFHNILYQDGSTRSTVTLGLLELARHMVLANTALSGASGGA